MYIILQKETYLARKMVGDFFVMRKTIQALHKRNKNTMLLKSEKNLIFRRHLKSMN